MGNVTTWIHLPESMIVHAFVGSPAPDWAGNLGAGHEWAICGVGAWGLPDWQPANDTTIQCKRCLRALDRQGYTA